MTSSSSSPKLPLWIFLVTDVVLLGTAAFIARQSARPLSENAMFAIVACIIAGATIGLVPLIIHFERQKNEMLDDRQRALEALARTVGQSAEQISIAAGGLHEMADLTQRNLKHAEQLPHKLQEKIAEFQVQLANANDAEREEMEKELEELRGAETDRLQSTFDKVAKTAADFAKLEAATQQHLTATNDALARISASTTAAVSKAQAAAEQALARASQDAAKSLSEAGQQTAKSIEVAKSAAAVELTALFDAQLARLAEANRQLTSNIETLSAATKAPPHPTTTDTGIPAEQAPVAPAEPAAGSEPSPRSSDPAPAKEPSATPAPKRPRKQRQESLAPVSDVGGVPSPRLSEPSATEPPPAEQSAPLSEPPSTAPAPAEQIATTPSETAEPEASAVVGGVPSPRSSEASTTAPAELPAPVTEPASPSASESLPVAAEASSPRSSSEAPDTVAQTAAPAPAESPKPARKKRKADDDQPGLGLVLDEPSANGDDEAPGVVERVLTSDGATRLIVTAYIGIGNRLFIRGNGPGLSWDKGVPLQFVSIGKWRWETSEAAAPIDFKLLKNDEQECAGLGKLTIEPGHQHEVTATFS